MSGELHSTPVLVVGIGASAGGIEALKELFTAMPSDSGLAFVVIQHLEPTHESRMADILGKCTGMKVVQAEDGMVGAGQPRLRQSRRQVLVHRRGATRPERAVGARPYPDADRFLPDLPGRGSARGGSRHHSVGQQRLGRNAGNPCGSRGRRDVHGAGSGDGPVPGDAAKRDRHRPGGPRPASGADARCAGGLRAARGGSGKPRPHDDGSCRGRSRAHPEAPACPRRTATTGTTRGPPSSVASSAAWESSRWPDMAATT